MGILDFITGIFKPVADMVDSLHTSKEEKMQLKNQMTVIQNEFAGKILDYETRLMEVRAEIVKAEVQGGSWLQRNWRPITMLMFLILVVLDAFGILPFRLADEAWTLLQIGMGGYVIGRSAEKIAPSIMGAFKKEKSVGE